MPRFKALLWTLKLGCLCQKLGCARKNYSEKERKPSTEVRESSCQTGDSDTQRSPPSQVPDQKDTVSHGTGIDPVYTSRGVCTDASHSPTAEPENVSAPPSRPPVTSARNLSTGHVTTKRVTTLQGAPKIQEITRPRTYSGSTDGSFEDASSETGSFLEETRPPTPLK